MSTPPTPPWEPPQGDPQPRPRPFPQPQPPSPGWQPPPGFPPPPSGWQPPQYGPPEPVPLVPPTPPRRRVRVLAPVAAGVLLAGGGAATYVALSDTSSGSGAGSPQAAVANIVDDINSSDLVGMLDALVPAERTSIADPLIKDFDELKRIKVLRTNADLGHVSGINVHVSNLAYGPTVVLNDHVQIVQLTGGTVRATGTASQLPLSSEFVQQAFPRGLPAGSSSDTADLANAVRQLGRPIRIATEKVDGRWYPSVLYTIADNAATAAGIQPPSAGDRVPAVGAGTPEDAVRTLVRALVAGNVPAAIQVLAPDELAAVHDYGGVITRSVGRYHAPFTLGELDLDSQPGTDGSERVHLTGVVLTMPDGEVRMTLNGDCVQLSGPDGTRQICTADVLKGVTSAARTALGRPLTADERRTLQDLFGNTNVAGGGIVTTKVDGQWYVNPLRTLFGGTTSVLDRLQGDDVLHIIGLLQKLGR